MTHQEFYQHLADRTGEDVETIESLGFEIETHFSPDRKELKRQRRLKLWRQQRRLRNQRNQPIAQAPH